MPNKQSNLKRTSYTTAIKRTVDRKYSIDSCNIQRENKGTHSVRVKIQIYSESFRLITIVATDLTIV